jgi:ribosomal protein L13
MICCGRPFTIRFNDEPGRPGRNTCTRSMCRSTVNASAFDTGDYVILINAEALTVDRHIERVHVFRPGRPGSSLKRIVNGLPQQIIEKCIYGMMPNGLAKKQLSKRLKIYQGATHPHAAQNPIQIEDIETFTN